MSAIGKSADGKGYKKIDRVTDKPVALGVKKLVCWHKFSSAGLTDIDLTSLTMPTELSSLGLSNPSTSSLLSANMYLSRENVKVVSSSHNGLMRGLSFDVISNSLIRLKNGARSSVGEIIEITIDPVNTTGIIGVDGTVIVQTGQLTTGQTDIVVNQYFTYNKYSSQQIGDVIIKIDGIEQFRNVGNSVSGAGNYYEIAPSAGNLSNTIRLNAAVVGTKNYSIVSNGIVAERPTAAVMAAIQTMSATIDQLVQDLALVTANPTSRYQLSPSAPDQAMFSNVVKSIYAGGIYDAVVGSAADVAASQATHTSLQAAHDSLASGSKILLLGKTIVENLTISKKIAIEGKGHQSFLNGTLTIQSGGSLSYLRGLRIGDNISIQASANSIFLRDCWQVAGKMITDSGTGNSILVVGE